MDGKANAVTFCLRHNSVQEILKICPECVGTDRERRVHRDIAQIKARHMRAAALWVVASGAVPADLCHKVGADGRKAVFRQQRNHLKNLFNRSVAQSICALDVIVDAVGHRLDDKRAKPFCLKSLGNRADVRRVRHIKSLVLRQRPLQTAVCCVLQRCRHGVPSAPTA